MKKILFLMNVDWKWIKQRPHFIAQGLSDKFDVTAIYQYRYNRTLLQKRDREGVRLKLKPIYVIPMGDRYNIFRKLNKLIKQTIIMTYIKVNSPKFIISTFPDQICTIPKIYKGKIIYDCMDNHIAFINNDEEKSIMLKNELDLIKRASVVLTSSEKLKDVLLNRYGKNYIKKIHVVRNGYHGKILKTENQKKLDTNEKKFIITYFGAISSWFDFEILKKSLNDFKDITYEIIGPITNEVNLPKSERIKFIGTIEHDTLYDYVKTSDCLIMPFKVNDIIESVDPVKLYEYINFNKNILCVKYKEIERFDSFVHFYTDYDSFKKNIEKLIKEKNIVYSQIDRINFLKKNNWDNRVNQIVKILGSEEQKL